MLNIFKPCTKQEILAARPTIQHEIIKWTLGFQPDKLKHRAPSWLRENDSNPGCFFNEYKGLIQFVDFAHSYLGGKRALNCFDLVMIRYNTDFAGSLKLINQHFGLGLGGNRPLNITYNLAKPITKFEPVDSIDKVRPKGWAKVKYEVTSGKFDENDLNYWADYNITEDILKEYNVTKVLYYKKNGYHTGKSLPDNPIYCYFYNDITNDDNKACKLYRPLSKNKNFKWRTNATSNHIQGLEQIYKDVILKSYDEVIFRGSNNELQTSGLLAYASTLDFGKQPLIITKSLKDVMTLKSLGYLAIAPNAEGHKLPPIIKMLLMLSFRDIVVLYDNDAAGIKASSIMAKSLSAREMRLPNPASKDISDYVKSEGAIDAKEFMPILLNGAVRPI